MALESIYQRYRGKAQFFIVYLGRRDPAGYWLNISDKADLQARAMEAKTCPSSQGLTIPRLLDDTAGSVDYLYRVYPFRLAIVDIDGNLAYHSPNAEVDYADPNLAAVIVNMLNALLANRGRTPAAMVAKSRADQAGKRAAGLWLPRVAYFTAKAAAKSGSAVTIQDARGYNINVSHGVYDELQRKRNQVVRLFTPGVPPPTRPVVLVFVNGKPLPGAARLQAWYGQDRGRADFYLVYADGSTSMLPRAQAAKAFLTSAKLTLPCLLDSPENDATFAYGGQSPRLVVIGKDAKGVWTVKYISAPGATGFTRGIAAAGKLLGK